MNLKEKLEAAKNDLVEIKAAVESGEKSADDLKKAIDAFNEIQKNIEVADEAGAMLKGLFAKNEEPADKVEEAKSLGELAAKSIEGLDITHDRFVKTVSFKDAAPMITPSSIVPAVTTYDTNIVTGYRRPLVVRDLFGAERINGPGLKFFIESSSVEGTITKTTEAQQKPMMSFGDPTAKYVELDTIPVYTKFTKQMAEDAPFMIDYINGRLMYQHQLAVENKLVTDLAGTSGIGTASLLTPDGIFKAIMTVQTNSGFDADAILINPADYQNIRLRKDSNGQYYGGGFMYGPYGNGDVAEQPALWGVRTILTPAVSQGTCIVGAFKLGASVLNNGTGVTVSMANQNEDDFVKNLLAVLIEERLALAVRRPSAFVKITGSSTSTEA